MAAGKQIDQLSSSLGSLDAVEKPAVEMQLTELEQKKTELRQSELQAIEWKPLWGEPAIVAGAILLVFVVLFRQPRTKQQT